MLLQILVISFPNGTLHLLTVSVFNPDRLGVLSLTEISMLRKLNKLTNHGKSLVTDFGCRGIAQCLAVLRKSLSDWL